MTTDKLRQKRLSTLTVQIRRLDRRLADLRQKSARLAHIRLAVFAAGLILAGLLLWFSQNWLLSAAVWALALIPFGVTVWAHRRVDHNLLSHQIRRQIRQTDLARMTLDWEAIPPATFPRSPAEHPFARDLDLTGERSLHRLVDAAVSHEGSLRLRNWLLTAAPELETIHRRQTLVQALVPLWLFRDKLTTAGLLAATAPGGWRQENLVRWLNHHPNAPSLKPALLASGALVPLNVLLFIGFQLGLIPPVFVISLGIYAFLTLMKWQQTAEAFDDALTLTNGLKKLEAVFNFLETSPHARRPELRPLCEPFLARQNRPSARLKQLARLSAAIGATQNPMIGLALNLLFPWNLYFAHRLTAYKADLAAELPRWLDAWFELEALSSLANFAWLNPAYTFPSVTALPPEDAPRFSAADLGHPLIPEEQKVRNTFTAQALGQVGIITGSNMAGKSSFLRTVGVAVCLAYAGGPVDAQTCQTGLFRLFTALSVSDSVTDGISYFYAEVKRLKALLLALEETQALPLIYLIDEIFRGTNNRERFIGSRAYIKALAGKRGWGLIATHDLELVKLADELAVVQNYHFRETVADGRLVFDYRLRPGPCPTTNALKIMQLEGLPVDVNPPPAA